MNVQLLVIDPQNDFTDPNGSLYVSGAKEDMQRLAKMILRLNQKLDDIHVTLDSHRSFQIFHPIFWQDAKGNNPNPFTLISVDDVEKGKWITTNPAFAKRALEYVKALAASKRYMLCIWPYHCLIGSWGAAVNETLFKALRQWELDNLAIVDYCVKGTNILTENYSILKAEVEDPGDPATKLNTGLIDILNQADIVAIAGEALSHCVKNSVEDIADAFGKDNCKKIVILEDATSSVTGFEQAGKDFIRDITKLGATLSKTTEFLK